jgi:hypothetical protein
MLSQLRHDQLMAALKYVKLEKQHNLGSASKSIDAFCTISSIWKYKHRRDDWVFKGVE